MVDGESFPVTATDVVELQQGHPASTRDAPAGEQHRLQGLDRGVGAVVVSVAPIWLAQRLSSDPSEPTRAIH